ncbi:TRAP transporter small permease [Trichloromonas sp.]|uniref:TRAP transporter small permease n=1 Tax=Trichloromonas sp. TaxID=3069249 RepID=UPI002A413598|nr:TRAP transporter small permease [Trichloromonas sp.]
MHHLKVTAGFFARQLFGLAGAAIVAMMLLTCADVMLRLFGHPIPGTYELVSFFGAVAVAFAMAHTCVEKGHIAVSVLVQLLPRRGRETVDALTSALSLLLFALIAWRSVLYAEDLRRSGEVSLTLQLPFYPFIHGIGLAAAAVCLVLLADLVRHLQGAFRG